MGIVHGRLARFDRFLFIFEMGNVFLDFEYDVRSERLGVLRWCGVQDLHEAVHDLYFCGEDFVSAAKALDFALRVSERLD